ncbi:MAG: Biopolymer transport protein ExbB [Alphaproteobacteria bacterium MarineAlpha6_Bin6]|nr:protein TolQ [Pelagibacteraceae bacterium]PPR31939.1 MAG: Biopolymer transport protein ExbB [Alphaproteobacteria bacterium MarineAlpha6_Bin6]PPR33086.1 MAG: Biopolymer transport protein ExbB [Alphaproteobacteria bacterium MarineAlpha6_Bin5]|tara:strand:- start:13 stop:705 length:693 start_codon:yes stop_codon:yes gene_type:complete
MENQAVDAVNLVQNSAYDLSIFSLFLRADPIVKFVMIGLFLSSVWSWAIIINKIKMIRKINNVTKKFEDIFWSTSSLEDLYTKTESKNDNPMIAIFNKSMIEWLKIRNSKIKDKTENRLNSVMVSSINNEMTKLEKNMIFLASLGSAAPFVGLFGTVWGIMNSFQAIGITKNTSLAVVAPGIAEALFATALGLIAAIPAVIAYNKISSVLDNYSIRLETFAQEFINRVIK